jgi:hypothetical protein
MGHGKNNRVELARLGKMPHKMNSLKTALSILKVIAYLWIWVFIGCLLVIYTTPIIAVSVLFVGAHWIIKNIDEEFWL